MQNSEKKAYTSPTLSMIGTIADETQTFRFFKKEMGPGDQYFFTDPPTCLDTHFYNNCEETSA